MKAYDEDMFDGQIFDYDEPKNESEGTSKQSKKTSKDKDDDCKYYNYKDLYFNNSYLSKECMATTGSNLRLKEKPDINEGFDIEKAKLMSKKDSIKYAFFFATLRESSESKEAARRYIVYFIKDKENSMDDILLAKDAFVRMFGGYVEMQCKKYYQTVLNTPKRLSKIEEGKSYVWLIIMKKLDEYDGKVAVSTFFGRYITSWLTDLEAKSRGRNTRQLYKQDRLVLTKREELRELYDREPTFSELIKETGLTVKTLTDSLRRIDQFDTISSLDYLNALEGDTFENTIEQTSFEQPEDITIKNEDINRLYGALNNLEPDERRAFLAYHNVSVDENGSLINIGKTSSSSVSGVLTKNYSRVAKTLNVSIREAEKIFRQADKKVHEYFNIRTKIKNDYITDQDILPFFNKKEDKEWNDILSDISDFKPDK